MADADNTISTESSVIPAPIPDTSYRRRRVRRAVARIGVFFAVLAATILIFDYVVGSGLRKVRTSKFGSMNRIVRGQVNADIVVSGSSRALNHYDPSVISRVTGMSAYNLGMNGTQIDVQGAILKTYLRHNRKPKVVIQNLEAFTFEPSKPGELYDPAVYVPYLSEPELFDTLVKIDPAVWKWKYIPLYGYTVEDIRFTWMAGVLGYFGYSGVEDYRDGFFPRDIRWTEDFARFRASIPNGIEYRIDPRSVHALIELLSMCQSLRIPVLLVYSPEYYEMQDLEKNRLRVFSIFRNIAARFDAEFWDYSDSPISRTRDNFYNSQHLNAKGATLFSEALAQRLRDQFNRPIVVTATE